MDYYILEIDDKNERLFYCRIEYDLSGYMALDFDEFNYMCNHWIDKNYEIYELSNQFHKAIIDLTKKGNPEGVTAEEIIKKDCWSGKKYLFVTEINYETKEVFFTSSDSFYWNLELIPVRPITFLNFMLDYNDYEFIKFDERSLIDQLNRKDVLNPN